MNLCCSPLQPSRREGGEGRDPVEAGQASSSTGAPGSIPCGGGTCYTVTTATQCATWCYQSLLSGYAHLGDLGIACVCPVQGERPWN